jgi:hypothetical protein
VRTDFTLSKQSGQVLPLYLNLFPSKSAMPQDTNTEGTATPFGVQAFGIGYSISKIPMFTFDADQHHK